MSTPFKMKGSPMQNNFGIGDDHNKRAMKRFEEARKKLEKEEKKKKDEKKNSNWPPPKNAIGQK